MQIRTQIADYWDAVLERWINNPGDPRAHFVPPLEEWSKSYSGCGKGAVDLSCYPDPYVGDLRGAVHDVRVVVLGLNPGVGYPTLQGHHGLWTERIRETGYSNCFNRSPAEDPEAWSRLHGKQSPYWRNLISFTQRWLRDNTADVHSILNFELYPWHSNSVVGQMAPPAFLIENFVWAPAQEVPTPFVFAFGAPWLSTCRALPIPEVATWGAGGARIPGLDDDKGWRVAAFLLPSGQFAVVSSQPGYSGPPGAERLEILRALLSELHPDEGELQPNTTSTGIASAAEVADSTTRRPGKSNAHVDPADRNCMRCGRRRATWLVTGGIRSNAPGRLLVYCHECRAESADGLDVALPLAVFDQQPEAFLTALYLGNATGTDPQWVSTLLGVPPGSWTNTAYESIARIQR